MNDAEFYVCCVDFKFKTHDIIRSENEKVVFYRGKILK